MKATLLIALVFACLVAFSSAYVNHDLIEEINNDARSTWTAGVNPYFEGEELNYEYSLILYLLFPVK